MYRSREHVLEQGACTILEREACTDAEHVLEQGACTAAGSTYRSREHALEQEHGLKREHVLEHGHVLE
jgi:hypothetical protein